MTDEASVMAEAMSAMAEAVAVVVASRATSCGRPSGSHQRIVTLPPPLRGGWVTPLRGGSVIESPGAMYIFEAGRVRMPYIFEAGRPFVPSTTTKKQPSSGKKLKMCEGESP